MAVEDNKDLKDASGEKEAQENLNASSEPKAPKENEGKPLTDKEKREKIKNAVNGYVPGEPKRGIAEFFRIMKERRLLRKDLKAKGMPGRKDFNEIAEALGLVYWKLNPIFVWLHFAIRALLSGMGLKFLLGAAAAGLVTMFLISTITEAKGSFTINMTGDMLQAGYVLSENNVFDDPKSRLFADSLDEVNNITMEDIDPLVDSESTFGAHNGNHYFAYTFFIKNSGEKQSAYSWKFLLTDEIKNVSDAVWIMLYEDGKQVIYTRESSEGVPEMLEGFDEPLPFADRAYDEEQYYTVVKDGVPKYGIKTTPYADGNIVAQGLVTEVEPGEMHKYTVVLWIEGWDPDCTDDRFGGYAKFEMEFDDVTDKSEDSIFTGVYRTEYENYGAPKNPDGEQ